ETDVIVSGVRIPLQKVLKETDRHGSVSTFEKFYPGMATVPACRVHRHRRPWSPRTLMIRRWQPASERPNSFLYLSVRPRPFFLSSPGQRPFPGSSFSRIV